MALSQEPAEAYRNPIQGPKTTTVAMIIRVMGNATRPPRT
jgi:hypothetical protein